MQDDTYVDGINPRHALTAPSAVSRDVPHTADPANRFADQMSAFDRMRKTNEAFRRGELNWSPTTALERADAQADARFEGYAED